MQKNKSRSFWLLNLCYWAVYNLSQAFGSPTISAINLSQRFLLIGAFIFFMMFITGIYRFVYRRFQFDNQKTLFIIAQTLVGVLLIWGIDLLARSIFPSKTFDSHVPKFIAIAVWVGAYNFYKFRSRPQDTETAALDNQNATTTNSFVQNSPIQEPNVEKTPIEIQTEIELNYLPSIAPDATAKIEQTVEKEIEHLNRVSPIAPIEDIKIKHPAEIEVEQLNLIAQVAPIEGPDLMKED